MLKSPFGVAGYDQVAFIGHSQGNATMFVSLGMFLRMLLRVICLTSSPYMTKRQAQGMIPDLGNKLSVFIALAPAVFAGPLTNGFLFSAIKNMDWKSWKRIFGVLDMIPIMRWAYDYTPSLPFAILGYQVHIFSPSL